MSLPQSVELIVLSFFYVWKIGNSFPYIEICLMGNSIVCLYFLMYIYI